MSESDTISLYLKQVIKNENFLEYDIKIHGKTGRGDGYMGNIIFVTVSGKTKNEERKESNLVLKVPSSNQSIRKQAPIREVYQKEIYIYDQVIPVFKDFQDEMGVKNDLLDFLPRCFLSDASDGHEFLILQNLKSYGFDVWDRLKPMPYGHVKLVLEALGKWHAFSFALKHKRSELFEKLVEKNKLNLWPCWVFKTGIKDAIFKFFDEARGVCKSNEEITEKLTLTKNDVEYIFTKLYSEDPDHQVILHGDSWTNNFLFKNVDDSKTPSEIYIIDFQMSGMATPVTDVSYFIYTCVDTGIYKDVEDLLNFYYQSLSSCLVQLGCSTEIFPYDTLLHHWQRFSCYGIITGTFGLKFFHAEADEAPDFTKTAELGKDFLENCNFSMIKNKELYNNRVRDNFLHYIRNLNLTTKYLNIAHEKVNKM